MSQLALFEPEPVTRCRPWLWPEHGCDHLWHVVMPNMAYACGQDILDPAGHGIIGPSLDRWERVTCPECLAPGREALAAECHRIQRRQA